MTLNSARLTIDADVDGDGSDETGTFEFEKDVTINPRVRTGYLVGPRGAQAHNIISELRDDGEDGRKNFVLDLGGGVHTIDIEFTGIEGDTDQQWGNNASTGVSQTSATGGAPMSQASILMRYWTVAEVDSLAPATLEWGEFSSSGVYSALDVAVEEPSVSVDLTEGGRGVSSISGSVTCIVVASLKEAWDAAPRNPY